MARRLVACRACGKPVTFALVANKQGTPPKRMPLNPAPDPDGNVAVYRDGTGTLVGRVVGKGGECHGYERLMMPHFATCEARKPREAAQPEPEGVTFLERYRKARVARGKAQRRRRPRQSPITGIQWRP